VSTAPAKEEHPNTDTSPISVHKQKTYPEFENAKDLSVTQTICGKILSLPLYPSLTDEEVTCIGRATKDAIS
jgi:dTDP-4-amino-4,6-dideoxygalactose transaminase